MKTRLRTPTAIAFIIGVTFQLYSQGYIVPNGVTYAGTFLGLPGYGVTVVHDPTNGFTTGFSLNPVGKTQPTVDTNTFEYNFILDVGVRAFLVSSNQPISQQVIQSGSYAELMSFTGYVFNHNSPFYVGLYTGNQNYYPPDGIYTDPLFGWALLVNNRGVIEMLDSALEYKGGGIFAGTQNIIPIPEPGSVAVLAMGALLLGLYRRRTGEE